MSHHRYPPDAPIVDGRDRIALCLAITPCLQRTLVFPRLALGAVNRARSRTLSAGGKSVNVARTLKALGHQPLVLGFSGGDTGTTLTALLQRADMRVEFVATSEPTRTCTTLINEANGVVTELVEEAPCPTPAEWQTFNDKWSALLPRCTLVIAAGALPPGAAQDTYARLAVHTASTGRAFLLDAKGPALEQALAHAPLLVKLNRLELSTVTKEPLHTTASVIAAAQALALRGAQWVLVTQGPEPAWLVNGTQVWGYRPPVVRALNPVGSGDATTGGIAAALLGGRTLPEAVRWGIACGAANATTLTAGEVPSALTEQLATKLEVWQAQA